MWQSLLHKYIPIRTAIGVEIVVMQDKSLLLNAVVVKQVKGKLIRAEEYINVTSLPALIEKFPKGVPVGLNISGRGILHKPVPSVTGHNLLENVIPGARQEDYYYQQFVCNDKPEIAVIRKDQLDEMVGLFVDAGISVLHVGLSLGFSTNLLHLIKINTGNNIQTSAWQLQLHGAKLIEYTLSQVTNKPQLGTELIIGDQSIKHLLLPAFAIATEIILASEAASGLQLQEIARQKEKFEYRRLFNIVGIGALGTLLLILLLNVFIYQHYYTLAQEAQVNNSLYQKKINTLDTLQVRVQEKEKFLAAIGWIKQPVISEISDKIGASVPKEVILTNMTIFPEDNNKSSGAIPRFRQDTIRLQGDCNTPWVLNNWITSIQQIDIVQSARLESYWYKKEDETGHFQLELTLK